MALSNTVTTQRLSFPSRADWLARRRAGLGASDAAAILGLSPFATPLSVYADKLGLVPERAPSERQKLGLRLEPVVADLFHEATGLDVLPAEPYTLTLHSTLPWLFASLDRELYDPARGYGVLECKTAGPEQAARWQDEPPVGYQVQVQHQLAVTGYTWGAIAVLLGGVEFRTFLVERHERLIENLLRREASFWEQVEMRTPPVPQAAEVDRDLLAALYPVERGPIIPLGPEYEAWDTERQEAMARVKEWETRRLEAENFLKAAIADAAGGVLPNGTVYSWKTVARKGYTVEPSSHRELRRKEARYS